MKKILSILSIFAITATSTGTVISCNSSSQKINYIEKAWFEDSTNKTILINAYYELSSKTADYIVTDITAKQNINISSVSTDNLLSYTIVLYKSIPTTDKATITFKNEVINITTAAKN